MKILIFKVCAIVIFLCINTVIFSQSDIITEGIYNGEPIKYYKNKLILGYRLDSLDNSSYISRATDFILSNGGSIDSTVKILNFIELHVTLMTYNSDAINYVDDFKNSNLFEYVCLSGVIEPN